MYYYLAYQLIICSDHKLKSLLPCKPQPVDVHIHQVNILPSAPKSVYRYEHIAGDADRLWIDCKAFNFYIEKGSLIQYVLVDDQSPIALDLYLMGSCFGAVLMQRGYVVLHANTIAYQNKATCFVGFSGAGKSTMAAWHLTQGAKLVSDDVTAIYFNENDEPMVIPGFQRLKLWGDTLQKLGLESSDYLYSRDSQSKYNAAIEWDQFIDHPISVEKIVWIQPKAHEVSHVKSVNAIHYFYQHTYRRAFIKAMNRVPDYLKKIILLSNKVSLSISPRKELDNVLLPLL